MKICLVSRYFDLRNTGIGRFSSELAKGLANRNIYTSTISTNLTGMAGYLIYTAMQIPFKIPSDHDVYHALTPLEAMYLPKKRSIVTFHDLIPLLYSKEIETHYTIGMFTSARKFISKNYFKIASSIATRCSLVVCTSEHTKNELTEHLKLPEDKIKIIRFGINENLKPDVKKDDILRIGVLSHLGPRKRIDLLIQAFIKSRINGQLIIGGSGPEYSKLKILASKDERIIFKGFIPETELVDFYNSLDYFIFPTKVEGYGLPIIEAFACKKPVIVLEDAIIPYDIKSKCTTVNNLADFFDNPFNTCAIEKNYKFAAAHNWDTCIDNYLSLYNAISTK
jgi:glycosyltransferase involved in cell wall biosynthesis